MMWVRGWKRVDFQESFIQSFQDANRMIVETIEQLTRSLLTEAGIEIPEKPTVDDMRKLAHLMAVKKLKINQYQEVGRPDLSRVILERQDGTPIAGYEIQTTITDSRFEISYKATS